MSIDQAYQRSGGAFQRLLIPLGFFLAGFLFVSGTIYVYRIEFAASLIAGAMRDTGMSGVSLRVTRADLGGLTVEDIAAEDGALRVARVDVSFSIPELLRSRLKALTVDGLSARLAWDDDGLRLGTFRPRRDSEPLKLPHIETLRANDMMLALSTPTATYRAPFTVSAQPVERGWDAVVSGSVDGPGASITVDWRGVIAPDDLSQSAGEGSFDLAIDDFTLPDTGARLTAHGRLALEAEKGVAALRVAQPLTFSAVPARTRTPSPLLKSLESLPWSLTIAPSQSEAALVLTSAGTRRTVRVDVAATGQAGDGRLSFVIVGEGARSPQETEYRLAEGHVEVQRFPLAGGTMSGQVTLSEFAGTMSSATGKVNAAADVSDISVAGAEIGHAVATVSSTVTIGDGGAKINLDALKLGLSRGAYGDWNLAAPTELSLANASSGRNTVDIGLMGLRNSGELAFALPELVLSNRGDENARIVVRAPELRVTASTMGLKVEHGFAARNVALIHPSLELQDGRFDLKFADGEPSGTASARIARLGASESTAPSSGGLLTTATIGSKRDDLTIRGSFSTAAGTKLGDYTFQASPDLERGSANFSMEKTRFERGGKVDPAEIAFLGPINDLSGTIGIAAKSRWTAARRTESATLTLDDVSFALGDASVVGLTTAIDLTGLAPLRSSDLHHLAIQSIAAGLPLSGIAATYTVPGDGTVVVKEASANVAGGRVTLADAVIPVDSRDGAFSLGIRNVDMGLLASQAKMDGLSVTGTLSGVVPLRRTEAGYEFVDGVLRSDAAGTLVYKPSSPSPALAQNQGGSLLLQALSNFAYDRLSITLNGPVTEDISLLVAIAGKNPDLYGGYPIEFNLNLSGRLTQILRQGFVSTGIPADLERQLRNGKPPG